MNIIKRFLFFLVIIITIIFTYLLFNGYILYKEAITEKSLEARISEIKNIDNFTRISDVPDYYLDAIISIEDHRFYSHSGIDFIATARAIIINLKSMDLKEGGSSISQQVAKNLCFSQEKTFYRKIAELFVVYNLEKNYTKDEILELYINNIYFGSGYYNVYNASKRLF